MEGNPGVVDYLGERNVVFSMGLKETKPARSVRAGF